MPPKIDQRYKFISEYHIVTFDGGLQLKPEPHLVPSNAARQARDVETRTGALFPVTKLGEAESLGAIGGTGPARAFSLLRIGSAGTESWHANTLSVSYIHWNNHLVYSPDGTPSAAEPGIIYAEAGTPQRYLGITPPATLSDNVTVRVNLAATWEHNLVHHEGEPITYTDKAYPLMVSQDLHGVDPEEDDWFSWLVDDRNTRAIFDVRTALAGVATVNWYWYGDKGGTTGWHLMTFSTTPALRYHVAFGTVTETDPTESPLVVQWETLSDAGITTHGWPLYIRAEFEGLDADPANITAPFIARSWQASGYYTDDPSTVELMNGTYKYKMTYLNTTYSVESAPGPPGGDENYVAIGEDIPLSGVHGLDLRGLPNPAAHAGEHGVDWKMLYRTLGEGEEYFLVTTLSSSTTSYTDWMGDTELSLQTPITSEDNYKPGWMDEDGDGTYTQPLNAKIVGLRYHQGLFFAVCGKDLSRLVWSKTDNPHAWPLENNLFFPQEIQGFISTDYGLLVVTEAGPWLVTGTETGLMIKRKLPGSWNCQAHGAMINTPYGVMWPSRNSIVLYDGRTVQDISRNKLNDLPLDTPTALTAAWYKDRYILASDVGTLIGDFRDGPDPKWSLWGWRGLNSFPSNESAIYHFYYDPVDDELWAGTYNGYRKLWEGCTLSTGSGLVQSDYTTANWITGEIVGERVGEKKIFDKIEVSYNGEWYYDLVVDATTTLDDGHISTLPNYNRTTGIIHYPEDHTSSIGFGSQIQLRGRGVIYEARVHYDYPDRFAKKLLFDTALVKVDGPCHLIMYVDGSAMDYHDGTLDGWQITGSDTQEYVIPFDPNTVGFMPQIRCFTTSVGSPIPSPNLRNVEYAAAPDEDYNEEFYIHGARISHTGTVECALYVDGTTVSYGGLTTLTGDGDSMVYCTANTRGKRMQGFCFASLSASPYPRPTSNWQVVKWVADPIQQWKDRLIMHGLKGVFASGTTVYLYADGALSSTTTVSDTGELHIFFAANQKGFLPQVVSSTQDAFDYETMEWIIEQDQAHSEPSYFHHVRVICDAGTTGSLYLDGAQHGSDTALSSGRNDMFFTPDSSGYLGQLQWHPGNGVRDFKIHSEPVSAYKDRLIVHAAKAMCNTLSTVNLYVDGTTSAGATSVVTTGENWIFPAANTKGRLPQLQWTNEAVDEIEWVTEPVGTHTEQQYFHHVRMICDSGTTARLYVDGSQHGSDTAVTSGRNDLFFTPNSSGFLGQVQWEPGTGVRRFDIISEPVSNYKDRMIIHGAKAMCSTLSTINLYVDGTTTAGATSVLTKGENWIFAAPNTKGRLPQLQWTNEAVDSFEWQMEPISKWSKRIIPQYVRVAHDDAVTSNLYLDGASHLTATLSGNYESDLFFSRNARGFLPQLTWSQQHLRILKWVFDPEEAYSDKTLVKGCTVTYEGSIVFKIHVDGTQKHSETLSNVGRTSENIELQPGAIGYVYQWSYTQTSANSGWVHKVAWIIEKEPETKNIPVPQLTNGAYDDAYFNRLHVTHKGAVSPATLSFTAWVDDVQCYSTNLTTYDTTDWFTSICDLPTNTHGHMLSWDAEGDDGFVRNVRPEIFPNICFRQTYPIPGQEGRVYLKGFYITYIGSGTLDIRVDQSVVLTLTLSQANQKKRIHYYMPPSTFGTLVSYEPHEGSKDSIFVFDVTWDRPQIS